MIKLPPELTTVTSVSKILSAVIFISLPIITFFVGIRYASTIQTPKSVQHDTNTPLPYETNQIETPTLIKTFHFENNVEVKLHRIETGNTTQTFWEKDITQIDAIHNGLGDKLIDYLYDLNDMSHLYYLGGNRDTYYELQPSGYTTITLSSNADIEQKAAMNTSDTFKKFGCAFTTSQKPDWLAVKCDFTYYDGETTIIRDQNSTTNCYVPIEGSNQYLSFEQPVKPASTNMDLCADLQTMGIQKATMYQRIMR